VKKPEVKYDWAKWNWIGSPVTSNHLLYMRADTPYKTIEDVRKATTAPKCGATGVASTGNYMPKLVDEVVGTKFDIVSGYVAGQDIDLAVERGELQCRAFTITAYFAREPFITWRKNNFVNVLFQTGTKRDARLKDSPTIYELMDTYKTNEAGRRLAKVILAGGDFGRPIVAPPGVPADRVKILRDSFDKTIQEPALLAEAEKRRLEIDPTTAQEMETLAKEVMATPPDVVARMRKLLGE
jgi:tripartite-type tricarboxylate transporter receptor subunit TctC